MKKLFLFTLIFVSITSNAEWSDGRGRAKPIKPSQAVSVLKYRNLGYILTDGLETNYKNVNYNKRFTNEECAELAGEKGYSFYEERIMTYETRFVERWIRQEFERSECVGYYEKPSESSGVGFRLNFRGFDFENLF